MTPADAFEAAAHRYKAANDALQAAFDVAIPPNHPLRVELRAASAALDDMVTDQDIDQRAGTDWAEDAEFSRG
jgi:hypothetical protein